MTGWSMVPLHGSLDGYAADWDALNARTFGSHPLLSSNFINGLLQHFGNGRERLCLLRGEGGMQAMCILRPSNALVWTSFLPAQAQLGTTLIPDPTMLRGLWRCIPGWVWQIDLLCNDPDVGGVLRNRCPPTHSLNHALTMRITLDGTLAEYRDTRSRHLLSNIHRYQARLAAAGLRPRLVETTCGEPLRDAVERYAALEGCGWKGLHGTALKSSEAQFEFFLGIMLGGAADCHGVVYEWWLGDRLAASRLALRRGALQVMLKTTYDEALADYSPGRMLLLAVIEQAFARGGGGAIEFYTDADPNQLEWANEQRWIEHKTLYRWPAARALTVAMRALQRRRSELVGGAPDGVAAHATLAALPDDARDFLAKAERRNVAFGAAWYANLVDSVYPDDAGVRYYVLRNARQVQAVLPLRAEKRLLGWRVGALGNFYTALYEPALRPGLKSVDLLPVLAAIERDFPGLGSFQLAPMDPEAHGYRTMIGALSLKGWFAFEYFAFGNWYLPVRTTWADYLATRGGTLRSTLKRMGKKFAAEGGRLEIVSRPKDVARAAAAYEAVYAASWKQREPYPAFMPGLLRLCAEKGYLRLGLAWLGEQPVAAQVWIVSHGRAEIYKLAYHEQYKAYAPGTLLTAELMQYVFETDQVAEVDYLIGDDPYKESWMSHRRERWGIIAYRPTSLRGLGGLGYEILGRAVKGMRRRLGALRARKRNGTAA